MTSPSTAIYTPFADGRTVHDIVEHSPALVNETWCRNLLRHVLDSLEQQYASGAPHRHISPDTLVMLNNGDALLLPAAEDAGTQASDSETTLAGDLHALAQVVHYAITAELPPNGPVGPRLYDDYSDELTQGIDRCLGPNLRLRPRTIPEMRSLLGLDGAAPAHADTGTAAAIAAPASDGRLPELGAPAADDAHPAAQEPLAAHGNGIGGDGMASHAGNAAPDASIPGKHEVAAAPAAPAAAGFAPADKVAPIHADAGLLRKSAAGPAPGTFPSSTNPEAAAPATAGLGHAPREGGRHRRIQRWAMVAGAAVVLLAAGGALISFLQQSDSGDVPALSLPPAEDAANGPASGNTVAGAAPVAADAPPVDGDAPAAGTDAPGNAVQGTAGSASGILAGGAAGDAAVPATPVPGTAPVPTATRGADAVVNGTTYKLRIKPWGTVYVNGIDRGVSPPVKRLTLGPGKHTIRIVNPNFPEHVRTLNAGAQEGGTIEHDFTAPTD